MTEEEKDLIIHEMIVRINLPQNHASFNRNMSTLEALLHYWMRDRNE